MKRFNKLYKKITTIKNIKQAIIFSQRKKKHYKEIIHFNKQYNNNLLKLYHILKTSTYKPCKYEIEKKIDKNKKERIIAKAKYFPDRIIQTAIMNITKPIFINRFIKNTYSAIENRGLYNCIVDIIKSLKNQQYFLKLDIKKFFQSVNHNILKDKLKRLFKDKKLLNILFLIIDSYTTGLPIGNYTSQYLANFFLNDLDHFIKDKYKNVSYFRYMDDLLLLGDKTTLKQALNDIKQELFKIDLKLKPYILHPLNNNHKITFIGYTFNQKRIKLKHSIFKRLKEKQKLLFNDIKHFKPLDNKNYKSYQSLNGWFSKIKMLDKIKKKTLKYKK